jgi:hypothetical protein
VIAKQLVWALGCMLVGVLHGAGDRAVGISLNWWQELPAMAAGGAVCFLTAWAVR